MSFQKDGQSICFSGEIEKKKQKQKHKTVPTKNSRHIFEPNGNNINSKVIRIE